MDNFSEYSISSRAFYRLKLSLDKISDSWDTFIRFKMSRDRAHYIRKKVISIHGKKIVNKKEKSVIKEYCKKTFESKAYWPWLALYTELRGEFKEGWIPHDYYRFIILPKMNPEKYMRFSEAKAMDHIIFGGSIIEPLFFRSNGNYYDADKIFKTKDEVKETLRELDDEIIVKPEAGRGGKGIIFKHSKELNLERLSPNTNLIFQKVVNQHHELNKLYPHSVNTFRVLTFIDNEGAIRIKFIVIRFGLGESRVDNASSGGNWIFVNQDGVVEPKAYDAYGNCMSTKHPDTGTIYAELEIPFIDKIITLCKKTHSSFPYTRIIGWDVFVDERGEPKLIEWNANNPFFMAIEALFGPFFNELIDY